MSYQPSCSSLFRLGKLIVLAVVLCTAMRSAHAVVTIAGTEFEDDAFADVLISSSGSIVVVGPPDSTLESVLTGPDLTTFAFFFLQGSHVELGFVDNVVTNHPGLDLALYEFGSTPDSFEVTVEGVTQIVPSIDTGYDVVPFGGTAPAPVNLATVDLDAFGLELGEAVDSVVIRPATTGNAMLALVAALPVMPVQVDIWPRSSANRISPQSRGEILVVILTTEGFDATTVDPKSVRFGPDGAMPARAEARTEDVDRDGDLDLVLQFKVQETGLQCGDREMILLGATFDGVPIEGVDVVNTVGCR